MCGQLQVYGSSDCKFMVRPIARFASPRRLRAEPEHRNRRPKPLNCTRPLDSTGTRSPSAARVVPSTRMSRPAALVCASSRAAMLTVSPTQVQVARLGAGVGGHNCAGSDADASADRLLVKHRARTTTTTAAGATTVESGGHRVQGSSQKNACALRHVREGCITRRKRHFHPGGKLEVGGVVSRQRMLPA